MHYGSFKVFPFFSQRLWGWQMGNCQPEAKLKKCLRNAFGSHGLDSIFWSLLLLFFFFLIGDFCPLPRTAEQMKVMIQSNYLFFKAGKGFMLCYKIVKARAPFPLLISSSLHLPIQEMDEKMSFSRCQVSVTDLGPDFVLDQTRFRYRSPL